MIEEEKRTRDLKYRIYEKIKEIEISLEQISDWLPEELEEYEKDAKSRAACEKVFEVISEYIIDVAIYTIRLKKLRVPNDDESTFEILSENNLISNKLCKSMIEARGMRNFIVHKYGEIDNKKVFYALKEQFKNDAAEFLEVAKKIIGDN